MYVLDTDICIALIKRHPTASAQFSRSANYCCVPTLVLAELKKGAYCSQKIQKNLASIARFIQLVKIVGFDEDAATEFGKIRATLRRIGKPTGEIDSLIAAVARSRDDILVTHNTRHFNNIPELQLEDWL